jgi:hypothetical protein
MAIHAVSGKPGGGKSYFAMKALARELRNTDRYIVTNLSVKLPELCSYMQDTYGSSFDAIQRLTLMDEEQTAKFWRVRGNGVFLSMERGSDEAEDVWLKRSTDERFDYTAVNYSNWYYVPDASANVFYEQDGCQVRGFRRGGRGVLYMLDELHLFFNAREWAKTGKGALYYLSQHRKCGDDVIWVTQFIENVDKQFRSVTQDFTYVRNFKNEKFMSLFQSLPWFGYATYQSPQSSGMSLQMPTERGRFLLDVKGIGACYDTAKGVGFAGGVAADTQKKRKGLPLWVLVVIVIAALVLIPLCAWAGMRGLQSGMRKLGPSVAKTVKKDTVTSGFAGVSVTNALPAVPLRDTNRSAVGLKPSENPVTITGMIHLADVWYVTLSDGRQVTSDDVRLQRLSHTSMQYDGVVYERALVSRRSETGVVSNGVSYVAPVRPSAAPDAVPAARPFVAHWSDGTATRSVATYGVAAPSPESR